MTHGCRSDRLPEVAKSPVLGSSSVQTTCPERAPLFTEQRLAGGRAPDRGAQPGRRGPEVLGGFEAEGKIKGRGTCARRNPCLHVGWRGTRLKSRRAATDAKRASPLVILRYPTRFLRRPMQGYAGIRRVSRRDDFRVRPAPPKNRQQRFVSQVLREVGKAGGKTARRLSGRPGARLGRGHVAARFTSRVLPRDARRVAIKTRLVNLRHVGARSTPMHLRYIEREGVGPDGEPGKAYGPSTDEVDPDAFELRGRDDRHQFRFIVSPEDSGELGDLRRYTRHLMQRMEADLGTSLDWVAVDHRNTDNPHTHIVLRGKDDSGRDLII